MFAMNESRFFSSQTLSLAFTEGLCKLHDVMMMIAFVNKQYISESPNLLVQSLCL